MKQGGDAIRFFGTKGEFGFLSNFSPHPIELEGKQWPTVEHFYQAAKFDDPTYQDLIRLADSPKRAKAMGQSRSVALRQDWEEVKVDEMREAVMRKFETHEDIRHGLLMTGDATLIEASPFDYYWGEGRSRTGKNMLGKVLMEVRESLGKAPSARGP